MCLNFNSYNFKIKNNRTKTTTNFKNTLSKQRMTLSWILINFMLIKTSIINQQYKEKTFKIQSKIKRTFSWILISLSMVCSSATGASLMYCTLAIVYPSTTSLCNVLNLLKPMQSTTERPSGKKVTLRTLSRVPMLWCLWWEKIQ